jgi:hypothetical protein
MERRSELKFSEATLPQLNGNFGVAQDFEEQLPAYQAWLAEAEKLVLKENEHDFLRTLQRPLLRGAKGWNEVELETKFIGPLFALSGIEDGTVGYFLERRIEAEVQGVRLHGTVDGLVSLGVLEPQLPYFCLQEYKKERGSDGMPEAQALAAMLAAQELHKNKDIAIYGLAIIGVSWWFMTLQGKTYTISPSYGADSKDLTDIFKMLKALKILIYKNIAIEDAAN